MPQFDFYSFSGQVLFSLLGFYLFYFLTLKNHIVSISEIIKIRQKLYKYGQKKYKNDCIDSSKKALYTAFIRNALFKN